MAFRRCLNNAKFKTIKPHCAVLLGVAMFLQAVPAWSDGTPAGTVISNAATVTYDLNGTPGSQDSNTVSITVVERIDVVLTLQSGQVPVGENESNPTLLFTVTNTGNGSETYLLAIDSVLAGDDFDPAPALPPIYFDSDGSGDLTAADVAYVQGTNDPTLAADVSVDVLLVNDIPPAAVTGQTGRSELRATSTTGTGSPGDDFPGLGDGGLDAVIGSSGGEAAQFGEYLVSDVAVNIVKSVVVSDPFGGSDPVAGATMTYSVAAEVTSAVMATASVLSDPIPAGTTYVPNSITLNAAALSDAIDADAGELDTSVTATVVVRLGDLTQADGVQTVEFQVTID